MFNRMTNDSRPLLIGGLDVGLHASVALLDLDGEIVCLDTLIQAPNSQILEHMIDYGNVKVLSTDRAKAPSQLKKISSSIGAKLVLPADNMTRKKKRVTIQNFLDENGIKMNRHEKAAFASAIFAYRKFVPTLKKLGDRLEKENRMDEFEKERKKLFLRMLKDI